MKASKIPTDLIEELHRLRAASAVAVSRMTAALGDGDLSGSWVGKLIGSLGGVEALLSVALDEEKPSKHAKKIILVVDDQASTRLMIHNLLEGHGYSVVEADTVKSAKAALRSGRFDMLVTDIHLPDGTGVQVAEYAAGRKAIDGRRLPVLAISADMNPKIVKEVGDLGASWISKKSLLQDLKSHVQRALSRTEDVPKGLDGSVNKSQLETITSMIPKAATYVDRSLQDMRISVEQLKRAREAKDVIVWRETCHALHGTSMLLGANRMTDLLRVALKESDSELVKNMAKHERVAVAELESVRRIYSAEVLNA